MNIELFKKQFQYEVDLDNACLTASKEIYNNSFNVLNSKYNEFRDDEDFLNSVEKSKFDFAIKEMKKEIKNGIFNINHIKYNKYKDNDDFLNEVELLEFDRIKYEIEKDIKNHSLDFDSDKYEKYYSNRLIRQFAQELQERYRDRRVLTKYAIISKITRGMI